MKNTKILEPGISDFGDFIKSNNYFIDKTLFIKDFFIKGSYVSLIPRPKRFGKTLNLSMIEHFFDIQKPESKELFKEFEIAKDKDFCAKHQNKYPVINISLKSIKDAKWEHCYSSFKGIISNLYLRNIHLLKSDRLNDYDKYYIENIISGKADYSQYKFSLQKLSSYLQKYYDQKVIIIIDEYDAPLINAFNNTEAPLKSVNKENKTYYEKLVSFMQTFLGEAYKGNICLKKGLLTGVMRVARESMFSDWNNVSVFDIQNPYFADSFGFTSAEIRKILDYFGLQNKIDDVKKWYNGYKFGEQENIYNPWSIVNFISFPKAGFKPYWVNTSDYSLIKSRIFEKGVKDTIERLISGQVIHKEIKENFIFADFETNSELLWTILFYSGFLTQGKSIRRNICELRIPNNEIKIVFTDIILEWIHEQYNITTVPLLNTFNYLLNNDLVGFEKSFKEIIGDSLSYFDTAIKTENIKNKYRTENEQIYHVYTLGLLSILSNEYIIKSNRESGEGRYDILLIPHDKSQKGVVIEIKSISKQQDKEKDNVFFTRINNEIDKALNQIDKNKYYNELILNKIKPENIIKLPIVFAGKEPFVNKLIIDN